MTRQELDALIKRDIRFAMRCINAALHAGQIDRREHYRLGMHALQAARTAWFCEA